MKQKRKEEFENKTHKAFSKYIEKYFDSHIREKNRLIELI